MDARQIEQAFESLSARGLPAVRGEIVEGDVAGYHYYPGREQAVGWFAQEGLATVDESFRRDNPLCQVPHRPRVGQPRSRGVTLRSH